MKVYVLLWQDRHFDPVIEVFTGEADARACAWQIARDNARHPENIREELSPWLLLRYSVEADDFVRVEAKEVDYRDA
jgi:hypothetical protein